MGENMLRVNMDNKITTLRRIAETGTPELIGGDMVTPEKARPIVEVFDQLSPKKQRKYLCYSVGFMFAITRKLTA